MATQNVTYRVNSLLSCALCLPADVLLCLTSDDIVVPPFCPDTEEAQPYPRSTLPAQIVAVVNVSTGYYEYTIEYDDALISVPLLVTTDISGVTCDSCLKTYIDESIGSEPFFTDNGDGTTTYTSAHGCETTFDAAIAPITGWALNGNAGTVLGTNFLGTTDNVGFDIRVKNLRALRILPAVGTTNSPSLIGGFSGNAVGAFSEGNVICGGGYLTFENTIPAGLFCFIGGGTDNIIEAVSLPPTDHNCIVGGLNNQIIDCAFSSVVGGVRNIIRGPNNFIGGGSDNNFSIRSFYSSIVGGQNNGFNSVLHCFIGGGESSTIIGGIHDVIGGGENNDITGASLHSSILGGELNIIGGGEHSNISGGESNSVSSGYWSAIGGGFTNQVTGAYIFLGGGSQNICTLASSTQGEMVLCGGASNQVLARYSSLVGGNLNVIGSSSTFGFIGGGGVNTVGTSSVYATIAGGQSNSIGNSTINVTIVGGKQNTIGNGASTVYDFIGGGFLNSIAGTVQYGVIVGGTTNQILAGSQRSSIVGGNDNIINTNAFASVIVGGSALTLGSRSFGFNSYGTAAFAASVSGFTDIAYFGNVDVWIGNTNSIAKKLKFFEANATTPITASQRYHAFEAPLGSGSNVEYILPLDGDTAVAGNALKVTSVATVGSTKRVTLEWS